MVPVSIIFMIFLFVIARWGRSGSIGRTVDAGIPAQSGAEGNTMNRLKEIIDFIENDIRSGCFIEPAERHAGVRDRLFDVIDTYKPAVIVKAGLGRGELAREIAERFDAYIVIVEPSIVLIGDFMERHRGSAFLDRLRFINGDFQDFPVDYYAADLLITVDYLNLFDSSKCIDEFRRALQFEGILVYGDVVLAPDDTDAVYDELHRMLLPLHNEYYLDDELRTVLELKDFSFVKGMLMKFPRSLLAVIASLAGRTPESPDAPARAFIESHRTAFGAHYQLDGALSVLEPYFVGCFMRNKPKRIRVEDD